MKLILSLGSNIGDKENNIRRAVALINDKVGSVVKMSSLYRSEPVGFVSDNRFVNVVGSMHQTARISCAESYAKDREGVGAYAKV